MDIFVTIQMKDVLYINIEFEVVYVYTMKNNWVVIKLN